jgi:hypothetical protein
MTSSRLARLASPRLTPGYRYRCQRCRLRRRLRRLLSWPDLAWPDPLSRPFLCCYPPVAPLRHCPLVRSHSPSPCFLAVMLLGPPSLPITCTPHPLLTIHHHSYCAPNGPSLPAPIRWSLLAIAGPCFDCRCPLLPDLITPRHSGPFSRPLAAQHQVGTETTSWSGTHPSPIPPPALTPSPPAPHARPSSSHRLHLPTPRRLCAPAP